MRFNIIAGAVIGARLLTMSWASPLPQLLSGNTVDIVDPVTVTDPVNVIDPINITDPVNVVDPITNTDPIGN